MPAKPLFKACKKCRALVPPEEQICPVCGSTEFTEEWTGMVILLKEESEVMKMFGAPKPWRYAINLK